VVTPLEQVSNAIGILAASPEDQQAYLIEIGLLDNSRPIDQRFNIDELGLQFEDANYLVTGLVRNKKLTGTAAGYIEKLNKFLLRLSGTSNSDFWTIQALHEDSRWAEVRALAQVCLSEMR
jgi:hypothetical protein